MKTILYVKAGLLWLCNNALLICMTKEYVSLLKEPSWRTVIGFVIFGFLWFFSSCAIIMAIADFAEENKIEQNQTLEKIGEEGSCKKEAYNKVNYIISGSGKNTFVKEMERLDSNIENIGTVISVPEQIELNSKDIMAIYNSLSEDESLIIIKLAN